MSAPAPIETRMIVVRKATRTLSLVENGETVATFAVLEAFGVSCPWLETVTPPPPSGRGLPEVALSSAP